MTIEHNDNPRERVLDEMEYFAREEAGRGDERALRTIQRLRALVSKPKPRPLHEDNGA